jgi:hypothetical protein
MYKINMFCRLLNRSVRAYMNWQLLRPAARRQATTKLPVAVPAPVIRYFRFRPLLISSTVGLAGAGLALCNSLSDQNQSLLKAAKLGHRQQVEAALRSGADPNGRHLVSIS